MNIKEKTQWENVIYEGVEEKKEIHTQEQIQKESRSYMKQVTFPKLFHHLAQL